MSKSYRIVVKDNTGELHYGKICELDGADLEQVKELVENFGTYNTFSFIMSDSSLMGLNPRNCIFAKLEIFEE